MDREERLAHRKLYYEQNKDKILVYHRQYYEQHKDKKKQYYEQNKDKIKQYYQQNKDKCKERKKQYYKQNKDKYKQREKVWQENNREQKREIDRKHKFKRRSLGFVPLNEPFEGSDAHHIDKERVIYMPKEMHRSIWHNVWTSENMEEINKLAWEFFKFN